MYLIKHKNGYRVCNHPMGPEKKFVLKKNVNETDADILLQAKSYLEKLNNLSEPMLPLQKPVYDKYIFKYKNGFRVKFSSEKYKYFVSTNLSSDILYKNAQLYLNNLKESKSNVQRLNGSGNPNKDF